jgi:CRP/FNR family cyclic AMP-dependent transcriptional regulator
MISLAADGLRGPALRLPNADDDRPRSVEVLSSRRTPRPRGWLERQPAALRQAILAYAHDRRLPVGSTLHVAGDMPEGVYGVIEGALALSLPDARSEMQLADLLLPGDWAGGCSLIDHEPLRFSAEALRDTTLLVLGTSAMGRIAAELPVSRPHFLPLAADALFVAEQALADLLIPCPHRRLAATLWRCARGRTVALPLSQAQLAALANVSRKLVNRTLQHFRRAGWIELSYLAVSVIDAHSLATFAEHAAPCRPAIVASLRSPVVKPTLVAAAARDGIGSIAT